MRSLQPAVLLVLAVAAVAPAAAQRGAPGGMDCKQLAAMPNAPMTVERCEAMLRSQTELQDAMQTRGGDRPGDEKMTCAQITAELRTMQVRGVSPETAAKGKAAGEELQAAQDRARKEAAALAAGQTARTAAAAAVPGNVVGGAVAAQNLAEQKALQERTAASVRPAQDRTMQANQQSMGELAASMRSNPRFARLIQLAGERNCSG